ncbi:MAG: hypothetical protein JNL12_17635 [Planctomycetes bacterium]|nr:hypothetical protein [Planctomycetota bacterium]
MVVPWCVALLVTGASVHAQAPSVGRVLRTMEIDGCSAAQRDAIAAHLFLDDDVANALARRLDEPAARLVADRLATLYHEDGFPAAEVTARLVDGVLHLRVVAGAERLAGPITVRGESPLSPDALAACLGKVGTKEALWQVGRPAAVGAEHAARIERAVVAACEANGRRGARVAATFDTTGDATGDAVGLVLTFAEPGAEVRIQSVVLQGDDEAHAKSSLHGSSFTPGMLATTAAIDGLVRHCLETGRYLRIEPVLPAGQVLDPLVLQATMRPGAETMQDVPREDIALLQRFLDGLRTTAELPESRALQAHVLAGDDPTGYFPNGIRLLVGRHGGLLAAEPLSLGGVSAPAVLTVHEQGLHVRLGDLAWGIGGGASSHVSLTIRAAITEEGTAHVNYGLGWSTKRRAPIEIEAHPGFVAYSLSTGRLVVRREEAAVHVEVGPGLVELTFDREGGFQAIRVGSELRDAGGSFAIVDAPSFADVREPAGSGGSAGRELLQSLVRAAGGDPAVAVEMVALLRSVVDHGAAWTSEGAKEPPLRHRPHAGSGLVRPLCARVATARAARGWPLLIVDVLLALEGRKPDAWRAAGRAFERAEGLGPLAWATAAQAHAYYGREVLVRPLRSRGREQLQLPALQRDLDDLCASVPFLAGLPQRLGATWRALPELRERFAALPPGDAGDRQAFELGIGLLWEHGGRDLLAAWLRDE